MRKNIGPIEVVEHVRESGKRSCTSVKYGFAETLFGRIAAAHDGDGLCGLDFVTENDDAAIAKFKKRFGPQAMHRDDAIAGAISKILTPDGYLSGLPGGMKLSLHGTAFQIAVWRALLGIDCGTTVSYTRIADMAGYPEAVRAAANAVGSNPISILVPCHRVVRNDGSLGGYYWGIELKKTILGFEADLTKP